MFYGKNLRTTALAAILLSNIPFAQAMEKEVESGNRKGWNIVQRISDDTWATTEEDLDFSEMEVRWKICDIDLEKMEGDLNHLPQDVPHKFYVIEATQKDHKGLLRKYLIDASEEEELDRLGEETARKTVQNGFLDCQAQDVRIKQYAIEMTEESALLYAQVKLMRLLSACTQKNDAAFQKDQRRRVKYLGEKVRKFKKTTRPEKLSRKIPI